MVLGRGMSKFLASWEACFIKRIRRGLGGKRPEALVRGWWMKNGVNKELWGPKECAWVPRWGGASWVSR